MYVESNCKVRLDWSSTDDLLQALQTHAVSQSLVCTVKHVAGAAPTYFPRVATALVRLSSDLSLDGSMDRGFYNEQHQQQQQLENTSVWPTASQQAHMHYAIVVIQRSLHQMYVTQGLLSLTNKQWK